MVSILLSLIIGLGLLGLLALTTVDYSGRFPVSAAVIRGVTWSIIGLTIFQFSWVGVKRGHVPPVGLDESLLMLGFLSLVLLMVIRRGVQLSDQTTILGLSLISISYWWGGVQSWTSPVYQGGLPLSWWRWASIMLLLGGASALLWLGSLSATAWVADIQKSSTKTLHLRSPLNFHLQVTVVYAMLGGGILSIARSWWGWARLSEAGLAALSLCLLAIAGWWLRFTWPQRRWWIWALTILSLISLVFLLPTLTAI